MQQVAGTPIKRRLETTASSRRMAVATMAPLLSFDAFFPFEDLPMMPKQMVSRRLTRGVFRQSRGLALKLAKRGNAFAGSRPGVEIVIRGDSHYARPEAEAALHDALEESLPAT